MSDTFLNFWFGCNRPRWKKETSPNSSSLQHQCEVLFLFSRSTQLSVGFGFTLFLPPTGPKRVFIGDSFPKPTLPKKYGVFKELTNNTLLDIINKQTQTSQASAKILTQTYPPKTKKNYPLQLPPNQTSPQTNCPQTSPPPKKKWKTSISPLFAPPPRFTTPHHPPGPPTWIRLGPLRAANSESPSRRPRVSDVTGGVAGRSVGRMLGNEGHVVAVVL